MKIIIYSYRKDEAAFIEQFRKKYTVELVLSKEPPTLENVHLASGCDCISIVTTPMDSALLDKFKAIDVRYISTRTIGYEHIDIAHAKIIGIEVGNVSYSPNTVAEYTVMLMLMSLRKVNTLLERSKVQDYSLKNLQGKELRNQTVGVIGTGRIGETVINILNGFGCHIMAYDLYEKDHLKDHVHYVPFDQLLKESDIITMHLPATEDNQHLINKKTIQLMKDNVLLINTSRGTLIHTNDLIDAIENQKIGGAALDVIENEKDIFYKDFKYKIVNHKPLALLKSYPNVIITPHTAFYTDQAVSDMIEHSIIQCLDFMNK
ncbi:D-lactate dehydrogenase [Natranaerovirga hydrolytica]|uniref:D-lactate dehydrogenase n=1 Tax=Natranaerovirga hydrolytica TaxID=680378 RepID=A0A4R1N6A7_9FIRM|nr:D-isomer specific 2-hydroxyacid dehydrogenase family protein [Natranaerovirga hydrolytica]TCK98163.1 D-lactate dehydrogenase [Natranaerovirga hydrolytica]